MERNENVEKLLKTVEKLGFSDNIKVQVREQMNNDLAEFSAYESVNMGPNSVDYQLNFSLSKNAENTNVYLNSVDVLLNKSVVAHHRAVMGYNTSEAETLLMSRPVPGMANVANKEEFDRMMYVHNARVDEKMKFLLEHAPDVFNALYVKYKPETDIKITPEMQKQQERLQEGLVRYNSFSSYYNLTKLELYNALDGGAILKTLFKTNKGEEQSQKIVNNTTDQAAAQQQAGTTDTSQKPDNTYKAWIKVAFDKKRPDGSYEMTMYHENRNFNLRKALSDFNFKETNERFSKIDVARFMEKGSLVELTNLNEGGDRKVLARANPEFKNLDLFRLTGEPIRFPVAYLKNQLSVEVGAVVSFKKANELSSVPRAQEALSVNQRMEKAVLFQSAKTNFDGDQKRDMQNSSAKDIAKEKNDGQPSQRHAKTNTVAQNGTVERKTRTTARVLGAGAAAKGITR